MNRLYNISINLSINYTRLVFQHLFIYFIPLEVSQVQDQTSSYSPIALLSLEFNYGTFYCLILFLMRFLVWFLSNFKQNFVHLVRSIPISLVGSRMYGYRYVHNLFDVMPLSILEDRVFDNTYNYYCCLAIWRS